jgi:hypothetical protein
MRGKDLKRKQKKAPPFLRARADYEKVDLLNILYIFPKEKEERKQKKRRNELVYL